MPIIAVGLQSGVPPVHASPVPLVGPDAPHWHWPIALQVSIGPQACPHEPQFVTVPSVVSQPLERPPLQSPKPVVHEPV